VRRTIALVVDDLSISFSDINFVRRALKKYIDRYVGDGDLVAIMRTSAGAGAAQQFTNDRRVLYAAVERVRPYLAGNGRMGVFAPVDPITGASRNGAGGRGRGVEQGGNSSAQKDEADSFREDYFTVGTLGALRYIVNGMSELPGRKSIILFSPGFNLSVKDPDDPRYGSNRVLVAARHLVDLANRAAVVIYAIDPRGLVYTGLTAADDASGMSTQAVSDLMSSRSQELFETQGGNQFLADQTGGLAFKNSNDILPAPRILEDLRGYYLIGYRPQGETFNRRFHTITVKLLHHPELTVRARKGFYGVPTDEARAGVKRTREQQMIAALLSPIAAGDVGMTLTGLFTNTEKAGSVVSAQLQVDARDLQFTRQPNGEYQAKLDVLGVTFADTGHAVDQHGITQTLDLTEKAYQRLQRDGLLYTINVPIKQPGAYQLRVVLRDNATDKIGSASQFVEVPDLKKNRLALSGVVMSGVPRTTAQDAGGAAAQASAAREGEVETSDPQSSMAVRRFRRNQMVDYACVIFNGRTDKTHPQPQLTAEVRLYRDGAVVFAGKEQPVPLASQHDARRLIYTGRLALGSNLTPGDYALQVVVTDQLRDDKYRVAAQWIDFEIVQ
jgi:VWFA-related protein